MDKLTVEAIVGSVNSFFIPKVSKAEVAKDKYGEILRITMDNGYLYSARLEGLEHVDVVVHSGKTHRSKNAWRGLIAKKEV
jgi:hypothetical protein